MHIALNPFQYQQLARAAAIVRMERVRQRQWSSYTQPLPRNRFRGSSNYHDLRAIRAKHGVGRPVRSVA